MPRRGKGGNSSGHGSSNSLRAKAAANAAIAAHNASTSSSHATHANQSPLAGNSGSGASSVSRQRDPQFDTEALIGRNGHEMEMHNEEESHNEAMEDEEEDEEMQSAMQIIKAVESVGKEPYEASTGGGSASEALNEGGARLRSATPISDDDLEEPLPPLPRSREEIDLEYDNGHHESEEEDDNENDVEEDDEIGAGAEGDMLDDEFDAPLTFDADGNPLPSETTTTNLAVGTSRGIAIGGASDGSSASEPGSNASSASSSGPSAAAAAGAAAATNTNDGFGSFAASLRGFSGMMANMSSRLRTLLTNLRNKSDPSIRMIALQELSELLSMSTEDTLAGYFQVDAFVKELVMCLRGRAGSGSTQAAFGLSDSASDDFAMAQAIAAAADAGGAEENADEMQLLACRCLANLIEAMPTTSHNIVANGAVPVLCSKLFEITFIDLAEQTISVSLSLSRHGGQTIMQEADSLLPPSHRPSKSYLRKCQGTLFAKVD